jgi:hypothetical protein
MWRKSSGRSCRRVYKISGRSCRQVYKSSGRRELPSSVQEQREEGAAVE